MPNLSSIAKVYGMKVNPDMSLVEHIVMKLRYAKSQYGAEYCPCSVLHVKDTICPCKDMREYKACRCGLYVPDKGEQTK